MAALTVADIIALDFGYLTGQDLLDFCPSQFLINQETVTEGIIERMVTKAYAEIISQLSSKCQIATELKKTPGSAGPPAVTDTRSQIIVKYVSLMAIKNIVSRAPGLPDHMKANFAEVNEAIKAIRMGQQAIPDIQQEATANQVNISKTVLISGSFSTLG